MRIAGIGAYIGHSNAGFPVASYIRACDAVCQHHQAVRIGEGEWPQENALNDGENCRRRTHAQGQHKNRRGREAGRLTELPQNKLQIEQK